ncbi:MAG: TolB family protein, partial [Candidatus Zixiibacteriota bacterium]
LAVRARKNAKKVAPALSPDGKWLAYVLNDMNNPGIYIATPDFKEDYIVFMPPVGTSLHTIAPSFSPDSKWLTFSTTDGSIWISDITGGGARRLSGPGMDNFPSWSK